METMLDGTIVRPTIVGFHQLVDEIKARERIRE